VRAVNETATALTKEARISDLRIPFPTRSLSASSFAPEHRKRYFAFVRFKRLQWQKVLARAWILDARKMTLWRHTKGLRGAAKHLALRDEYSFRKAVDERASNMNIRL